ncbi:carboxynorspermidine decarboxylase [Microbacter margulisiae]|nr:carboxynorspermidine decarboxylase [Microbacter margulisiae]
MIDYTQIPSPCFVLDEKRLRENLTLIRSVKEHAQVEIILAFKAFAMWSVFPVIREYIRYSTASSVAEAQLAFEEMGNQAHTYAPVYSDREFPSILRYSSHVTFNSLSQFEHFYPQTQQAEHPVSCGLRINPEYSSVSTDLYNPCSPGSRLGVTAGQLEDSLPAGIDGLHFHTLCESQAEDLEQTLAAVEAKFGHLFNRIQWLNMGGGHLMTRKGYDVEQLIHILKTFQAKYPHLQLILEPGSAFAWETGELVSTVLDVVDNHGIKTAMLDVSFACHMPDCLEMPYKPKILGAGEPVPGKPVYRMGGNSCLSGDYVGDWSFDKPLQPGDRIVFMDMMHYTMVKTTYFNGVTHPSIGIWRPDNRFQLVREFGYEDYKNRLS